VRTTRWFPEIRRSIHCLPAASYRRLMAEARDEAAFERRQAEQRDWERRAREARLRGARHDRRLADQRAAEARWERENQRGD
jgi:hypothetical protein